jgi:hypothetical protein
VASALAATVEVAPWPGALDPLPVELEVGTAACFGVGVA